MTQQYELGSTLRENARQHFLERCDALLLRDLGPKVTEENRAEFEGLMTLLGAVYGINADVMTGKAPDRRGDRFNFPRAFFASFVRQHGVEAQLHYSPEQVVRGLRLLPRYFKTRFPTTGMLHDLMVKGQIPEEVAQRWEDRDEEKVHEPPSWVRRPRPRAKEAAPPPATTPAVEPQHETVDDAVPPQNLYQPGAMASPHRAEEKSVSESASASENAPEKKLSPSTGPQQDPEPPPTTAEDCPV